MMNLLEPALAETLDVDSASSRGRLGIGAGEINRLLRERLAPGVPELHLVAETCTADGVRLRLPFTRGLLRNGSTLRGHVLMACAETAMSAAILCKFGELRDLETVRHTMDFARPIAAGEITIQATVCKLARSLMFAEATFIEAGAHALAVRVTATWAQKSANDYFNHWRQATPKRA